MKALKRLGILLLALLCALPLLSSCKQNEEEETVYYTVTFDSNGGSAVEEQTVAAEEAVREPTPPTREGYIFEGWQTERGSLWNFSSDFVMSDMTLTAKWLDASDIFFYEVMGNGVKITAVKKLYPTIAIPSILKGFEVTAIGDGVFYELSSKEVQKITLPHTITSVGEEAFFECTGITITFDPRAVLTEVGEAAFFGCDGLSAVRLGEGLSEIAPDTFFGCTSLREIRLPKSVTLLSDNAFADCSSLVSVMFHPELREIGDSAFKDCDALRALYFYGTETELSELREHGTANQNQPFLNATAYFYSATEHSGRWYLDDNDKPKLW